MHFFKKSSNILFLFDFCSDATLFILSPRSFKSLCSCGLFAFIGTIYMEATSSSLGLTSLKIPYDCGTKDKGKCTVERGTISKLGVCTMLLS